ncbi:MAG: spore germination protein [Bacillus sp. (in: Bacteria)]|nr:spore germination protein [Bacillus sp. (in: firmicutes)]
MKKEVHYINIAILIYMTQSAVTLFSLARITAEYFGTNGWLSLFPVYFLALSNIYLIILVFRKGEGQSIFAILSSSIPKYILYPAYFLIALVWSHTSIFIGKEYMMMVQMTAFTTVSSNLLLMITGTLAFLLLKKGIHSIIHASSMFFILTVWTIFLLGFHLVEFKFSRFTPFILQGDTEMVKGSMEIFSGFLGYQFTLLLFPYITRTTKLFKGIFLGHSFTLFIYLGICIVSYGFFSFDQLKAIIYPLISIMKFIETPIIERLENIIFSVFVLKMLVTKVMYYWGAFEMLKEIF